MYNYHEAQILLNSELKTYWHLLQLPVSHASYVYKSYNSSNIYDNNI